MSLQSRNSFGKQSSSMMTGRALNPYDGWSAIRKRARAAGFLTRLDVAPGGQPASGSTWRTTDGASPLSGWPSVNNRLYDRTKDEITP